MSLSIEERIAMYRLCSDLADCDTPINNQEVSALNNVAKFLTLSQSDVNQARNLDGFLAMMSLSGLDRTSKIMLVSLLEQVAKADGSTNSQESEQINTIRTMIGI